CPAQYRSGAEHATRFDADSCLPGYLCLLEGPDQVIGLPWDTTFRVSRQTAEPLRLAGLIPKCDAVDEVGALEIKALAVFCTIPFVFNRDLERFVKADWIEHVPAITDATVTCVIALPAGLSEPMTCARTKTPSVVEIIFTTSPLQARDVFPVDV